MPKMSAGLLVYRGRSAALEVLLVHPGGPIWARRDDGVWTIPKGELDPGEDELAAARREFAEETGVQPTGPFISLGEVRQKGGKLVRAWAWSADLDPRALRSNTFTIEWPPKSGQLRSFPEVDRAEYFALPEARRKINPAQAALLERLEQLVAGSAAQA
ncbi:MAG: NUDIX domain-containing protein [Planctomycetota bacterium]